MVRLYYVVKINGKMSSIVLDLICTRMTYGSLGATASTANSWTRIKYIDIDDTLYAEWKRDSEYVHLIGIYDKCYQILIDIIKPEQLNNIITKYNEYTHQFLELSLI